MFQLYSYVDVSSVIEFDFVSMWSCDENSIYTVYYYGWGLVQEFYIYVSDLDLVFLYISWVFFIFHVVVSSSVLKNPLCNPL